MKEIILISVLLISFLSCKKDYLCTMTTETTVTPALDGYPITTTSNFIARGKKEFKKYNGINEVSTTTISIKDHLMVGGSWVYANYTVTTTNKCNCK